MKDWLIILGGISVIIFILILLSIPLICIIVLGTYLATWLGLTGIVWWSFVILFWIITSALLALLLK